MSMPYAVHLKASFTGREGVSVHAIALAAAWNRVEGAPPLLASQANLPRQVEANDAFLGKTITADRIADIWIVPASYPLPTPAPERLNMAHVAFETSRIPHGWISRLFAFDRVWVATEWGRRVLVECGGDETRIDVVPLGVDPERFSPVGPRATLPETDGRFRFLAVGKYEKRKGYDVLMRAFDEEFAGRSDVALYVLASHSELRANPAAEIRRLGLKSPENVVVLPWIEDPAVLPALYRACDALVAPTRGEGWGLPIIEAMACGLPVITTGWSAHTAFANSGNAVLIGYDLVPAAPAATDGAADLGLWAEPRAHELRQAMARLSAACEEARRLGAAAADDVRRRWSWTQAARVSIETLDRTMSRW